MKDYKVTFVYKNKEDYTVRERMEFLADDMEECLDVVSYLGKRLAKTFTDVNIATIKESGQRVSFDFNLNYLC